MAYKDPQKRREQMAALMRDRYNDRRAQAYDKLGRRCRYCHTERNLMFDFKKLGQGSTVPVWGWSEKRVKEAIERMEVVCRGCYRAKREHPEEYDPEYARSA